VPSDPGQVAKLLRDEREARRELEKRLESVEDRAAAAQIELMGIREQLVALGDAVLMFGKIRGTLPFKAVRRLYRLLRR
jgi:hypothetical protein